MYDIIIKKISFKWDKEKNEINKKKHGISFNEACLAFFDDNARIYYDEKHSLIEDRYILVGEIKRGIIIVCYCYLENESCIRIISSRKATRKEKKVYQNEKETRKRKLKFR